MKSLTCLFALGALFWLDGSACTRAIHGNGNGTAGKTSTEGTPTAATAPTAEAPEQQGGAEGGPVGHTAGQFDYYLLSLSWSPQHCATRGQRARPDDTQCGVSVPYGFIVHGLWPQYSERGYPESCALPQSVTPEVVERTLKVMPSRRLIEHEWEKHGTCSGLSADQYFGHALELFSALKIPARFASPSEAFELSSDTLRQEILAQNPTLPQNGSSIAVACHRGYLSEIRLCYSKDFRPQPCTATVRDSCPPTFTVHPLKTAL